MTNACKILDALPDLGKTLATAKPEIAEERFGLNGVDAVAIEWAVNTQ